MAYGEVSNYRSDGSFQGNDSIVSSLPVDGRYIGPPIYFFFVLDTDRLTDYSQLVNLDGIARIAQKHGLRVQIIGAADSATGNDAINNRLVSKTCRIHGRTVAKAWRGCRQDRNCFSRGIDDYKPVEANRNACVRLLFPVTNTTD